MYSYGHQQYDPSSTFINPALLSLPAESRPNTAQQTFYPRSPTALEVRDGNVPRQISFKRVPMYELDQSPPSENIQFTLRGCIGPSVMDILHGIARLDNAKTTPFKHTGHRSTIYAVHWAGTKFKGHTLPLISKEGAPITLRQLAKEIALELQDIHQKLREQTISPKDDPRLTLGRFELSQIHLVAFSRYKTHWVPVWAVESR